jgi:molybdopterin converting factor subunit 1
MAARPPSPAVAATGATARVRVRVLYFAGVRDLVGLAEEPLELPPRLPAAAALALLSERHPRAAGLIQVSRLALDEEFAGTELTLAAGAELAVIPPVSGG